MTVSLFLIIAASLFVSWIIGANSVATAFGPVAGTDVGGVLRGALFAGIFGLLGALIQGRNVTGTVESGLLEGVEISATTGSVILLSAALLVIIGILLHIPTPVAFTVVGSILGVGGGLGASWNMGEVQLIAATWLVIPFVAVPLGYVFSMALRSFLSKDSKKSLSFLIFFIAAFCAFTAGGNLIGLAIGPLVGSVDVSLSMLLLLGGVGILFGAWLGGPRIVNAVSKDYSETGIRRSICALATATVIAQLATFFGIPVSFNEAIIASMVGSGLVVGTSGVQLEKVIKTGTSWVGSFFASMGLAWIVTALFIA